MKMHKNARHPKACMKSSAKKDPAGNPIKPGRYCGWLMAGHKFCPQGCEDLE